VAPKSQAQDRAARVSGWMGFMIAPPNGRRPGFNFGETFFKNIAVRPPQPTAYDWLTFDVAKDLDRIQSARAIVDATDPTCRDSAIAAARS
jgi:hypothetical protein